VANVKVDYVIVEKVKSVEERLQKLFAILISDIFIRTCIKYHTNNRRKDYDNFDFRFKMVDVSTKLVINGREYLLEQKLG
jgi:hypothetical protein